MKMLLAMIFMLAAGTSTLRAQQAGDFGAGVILGNPTGATAKLWDGIVGDDYLVSDADRVRAASTPEGNCNPRAGQ